MSNKSLRVIIDTNLWISFLITGDKDLLDMVNYGSTKIVTIADFLKK